MKEGTIAHSRERTQERFERRNRLTNSKRRRRAYCTTPFGHRVITDEFLEPLARFLAGEFEDKPTRLRGDLGALLDKLCRSHPESLALAVLHALLDCIFRGWDGSDTESAHMRLCLKMGRELSGLLALKKLQNSSIKAERKVAQVILKQGRKTAKWQQSYKLLESDWTDEECVRGGNWILECALALEYFCLDEYGFPAIAPGWQAKIDRLHEELLWRDPVLLPHINEPPPDWTGWRAQYDDRLQANFVRHSRPATKRAISEAFESGNFEHARGVNVLQRVAFRVDDSMLELVRRFEPDLAKSDILDAGFLSGLDFYLANNCDWRGRLNPLPHFNFAREGHVRALFKFARGVPLTSEGFRALDIHAANCYGLDKKPFAERIEWAAEHRGLIHKIADDPIGTRDIWKLADKPYRFVAACIELDAAVADPTMTTNLPVTFDGSCNGLQHLALLARDVDAATRVNLIDAEIPRDAYAEVANLVRVSLEHDRHRYAKWWISRFSSFSDKDIRKINKQPVMTYGYGATVFGMAAQVTEVYRDLCGLLEPEDAAAYYLARRINDAAEFLLPGPARVRKLIRNLAEHRALQGLPLEWSSPTGFSVSNLYEKSKVKTVHLPRSGVQVRYRVGDGWHPGIVRDEAVNAAAPNFVHSLDASHLIRVVNAAAAVGIDLVPVHDAYSCLAPHASQLNKIIRDELVKLYWPNPLDDLRRRNIVGNPDILPLPQYGELQPEQVRSARYAWH